ncbi:MAG TPA: Ig-like domain-containing protein, partial [Gemmatimonadaceae bacterium]|nr:Ig-like domain-containing protein [Gemmatimonadaceae bacterium]
MRALRRACRTAAALVIPVVVLSCRETGGPTGTGRIAPTAAAVAVAPVLGAESGEPVIPLRQARIRLFRLPGQVPERAMLDTLVPFRETDDERAITLDVVLTMANERFGMELALLDDLADVVYLGRDTVIAYTSGKPPAAKPLRLRYAGPDTAVARIELAPRDTVLAIGDVLPLRVSAFLRDGRPTSARIGFAVHGSSAMTVDGAGLLFARTPTAARTTWVVARSATGLVDSVAVAAIVPARAITVTPGSGRLIVGKTIALAAVARDSAGAPLVDRALVWRSLDPGIAIVSGGKVTGVGVGSVEITATSERATASALITVFPGGVARVLPSVARLVLGRGDEASVSAVALDALGDEIAGGSVRWSVADVGVASVSPAALGAAASAMVRGLAPGSTTLVATIDGVAGSIDVEVRRAPAVRVTVTPRGGALRV